MPMGMLLVVLDHDVLVGAVVFDGSLVLRMVSLGDTLTGRTGWSWSVQPGEDQTSRGVMLPPGRLRRPLYPTLLEHL